MFPSRQCKRETFASFKISQIKIIQMNASWILQLGMTVCVVWCDTGHEELRSTHFGCNTCRLAELGLISCVYYTSVSDVLGVCAVLSVIVDGTYWKCVCWFI